MTLFTAGFRIPVVLGDINSTKRLRYRQNFMETILICDSNIQLIKIHASNMTVAMFCGS